MINQSELCLWLQLDSPSFFNPVEASKIAELVEALLSSRRVQCKTSDIGIISAFRKQVVKLRAMLRARGLGAINTGQVEDFQGQEQKVSVGTLDESCGSYFNRFMLCLRNQSTVQCVRADICGDLCR